MNILILPVPPVFRDQILLVGGVYRCYFPTYAQILMIARATHLFPYPLPISPLQPLS